MKLCGTNSKPLGLNKYITVLGTLFHTVTPKGLRAKSFLSKAPLEYSSIGYVWSIDKCLWQDCHTKSEGKFCGMAYFSCPHKNICFI